MRRALGPIVTTGIALIGAAVVVANPLVTAPQDVSVPSVRLSAGAGAPHGMFDKALVDAIAVDGDDSTSPGAFLRQLFASIAADAGLLGGNAVSKVLPHDPAATPAPGQSTSVAPSDPPASPAPVDLNALANLMQPAPPTLASAGNQIGPELQQALAVVSADTTYMGQQVVAAAIAAAGLTVTEPALISQVATALANGDVTGAVNKAIDAARAPLRPPTMILDAVRTVAGHHGVDVDSGPALTAAAGTRHTPTVAAEPGTRGVTRTALKAAGAQDPTGTAAPAPSISPNGATDLSDGNKVTPKTSATSPNRPSFAVRDQIRTAIADVGAVVRKLTGLRPDDTSTAGSDAAN